jgi:hypothetical protein
VIVTTIFLLVLTVLVPAYSEVSGQFQFLPRFGHFWLSFRFLTYRSSTFHRFRTHSGCIRSRREHRH